MDGSDGRTDLRMSMPQDTGVFVRSTAKPDGSMLLMGARSVSLSVLLLRPFQNTLPPQACAAACL